MLQALDSLLDLERALRQMDGMGLTGAAAYDDRMAATEALRQALERCVERVDKIGFTFQDGREFLGWATEVTATAVLVSWAPSPLYAQATGGAAWEPEDQWVPLADITGDSVAAYDESERRWVPLLRP
ncbi:hypothetical protein ACWCRD_18675 [Streptomyces sp. NPDC002092]